MFFNVVPPIIENFAVEDVVDPPIPNHDVDIIPIPEINVEQEVNIIEGNIYKIYLKYIFLIYYYYFKIDYILTINNKKQFLFFFFVNFSFFSS